MKKTSLTRRLSTSLKMLALTAMMILPSRSLLATDAVPQLARDNNTFACDLYHQLSSKEGNLFFSPYSISTALAMTYGGARGETATQMATALHFSLPPDQLHPAFAALQKNLHASEGDGIKLAIANSIWPSNRYPILESYVHLLKSDYDVSVTPLDYGKTETARTTINQWVEARTQDKIKNLIGPGVLSPATELTLVNAIYFHGKWQTPFQPKDTDPYSFDLGSDKTEAVSMMWQKASFPYADLDSVQVLELPYQGAALSMLIVLPKDRDGLPAVESTLSSRILGEWKTKLTKTKVVVRIPKFKLAWGTENLIPSLKTLGIKDACDGNLADFSGIDGKPRSLFIGAVLHKAFIDVQEEGTEAAAATAVGLVAGAAPDPAPLFLVDHPFLFLIQDTKTGSILFIGRVTDPSAGGETDTK